MQGANLPGGFAREAWRNTEEEVKEFRETQEPAGMPALPGYTGMWGTLEEKKSGLRGLRSELRVLRGR
jgi:hypothetical protein